MNCRIVPPYLSRCPFANVRCPPPNPLSDRCPIAVSDLEIAVTDFGDRQNGVFPALLFTALATFPALQTAILSSERGYFWSFLSDLGFQKHADRRFHPKSPPTSSPKSPQKGPLKPPPVSLLWLFTSHLKKPAPCRRRA